MWLLKGADPWKNEAHCDEFFRARAGRSLSPVRRGNRVVTGLEVLSPVLTAPGDDLLRSDQARDAGVISRIAPGTARKAWAQIGHELGTRDFFDLRGRSWTFDGRMTPNQNCAGALGTKTPASVAGFMFVTC